MVYMYHSFQKLEIELPYDPAIPLLGIHTEETRSERDTCTPMFITALFIIARTWKQPRCPSAHNSLETKLKLPREILYYHNKQSFKMYNFPLEGGIHLELTSKKKKKDVLFILGDWD